jgi:hypothetical protein
VSRLRYARKVDKSQGPIVDALRAAGVWVEIIGEPVDLLCFYRGTFTPLECKTPGEPKHSKKRCERQDTFLRETGCFIVKTPEQALKAVIG